MYKGIEPKEINPEWPEHSFEYITCLTDGKSKKVIHERYLNKQGYTRESYQLTFQGAPLISDKSSMAYQKAASSVSGKKRRSETLTKLNSDDNFKKVRNEGVLKFWQSDKSLERREKSSERIQIQYENGLSDTVREYYRTRFQGSDNQQDKSKRFQENNPSTDPKIRQRMTETYIKNQLNGKHNVVTYRKKQFRETKIYYQSTYELDFLEYAFNIKGLTEKEVSNAPALSDNSYTHHYYEPDFLLFGTYVVEIKSWYIEQLQERNSPGILLDKISLVKRKGYKWIYVKDKDYSELDKLIS